MPNRIFVTDNILIHVDDRDKPIDVCLPNAFDFIPGNTYEACVTKVLDNLNSAIISFDNGKEGFLSLKNISLAQFIKKTSLNKPICQNDRLYVKSIKDAHGTKLASFIESNEEALNKNKDTFSYFISLLPEDSFSEIVVENADYSNYPCQDKIRSYSDEKISLLQLYNLSDVINNSLKRKIYTKDSGTIVFDSTEALHVIDVNSSNSSNDYLTINTFAAKEIARQIRLKNLSGIIIIDFINMKSKAERNTLIEELKKYVKDDICEVTTYKFSDLGLLEISRKRRFKSLQEQFERNCMNNMNNLQNCD